MNREQVKYLKERLLAAQRRKYYAFNRLREPATVVAARKALIQWKVQAQHVARIRARITAAYEKDERTMLRGEVVQALKALKAFEACTVKPSTRTTSPRGAVPKKNRVGSVGRRPLPYVPGYPTTTPMTRVNARTTRSRRG